MEENLNGGCQASEWWLTFRKDIGGRSLVDEGDGQDILSDGGQENNSYSYEL